MGRGLRCIVESMNYSACGHTPGDFFELDDNGLRIESGTGGFCFYAVSSILPTLTQKMDASDVDEWLATQPLVMCPDPPEGLRMRIEAMKVEEDQAQ